MSHSHFLDPVHPAPRGLKIDTGNRYADWSIFTMAILAMTAVWTAQYLVVAPAVVLWFALVWLARGAVKLGVLGLLLLCVPIVGWVLLAWLVFRRKPERAPEPNPAAVDVWRPWLWSTLRDSIRR